jgi:hypothetical protein
MLPAGTGADTEHARRYFDIVRQIAPAPPDLADSIQRQSPNG